MGTKKTRLLVTLFLLGLTLTGMIMGAIMKDAAIIITSLSVGNASGITYITGKTWNNNVEIKNNGNENK